MVGARHCFRYSGITAKNKTNSMYFWSFYASKEQIEKKKKVKHVVRLLVIMLSGKTNQEGRSRLFGVGAEVEPSNMPYRKGSWSTGQVEVRADLMKFPVSLLLP